MLGDMYNSQQGINGMGYVHCTAACRESVLEDMYNSVQGISVGGYIQ